VKYIELSKKKANHKVNKPEIYIEKLNNLKDLFNNKNILWSIDECYFSEKILPNYGYTIKGKRLETLLKPKN
jgi:hypothetical protein